jgi:predicted dehydrogenase
LLNNGSHMIDFVRMLLGEIEAVQAFSGGIPPCPAGPIPGDVNLPFSLRLENNRIVFFSPLRFDYYRENSLDIWGERGRLSIMQEGLGIYYYPLRPNRAIRDEREIASDDPDVLETTVGSALYHLYSNLADALWNGSPLWSPGTSGHKTAIIMEAILRSSQSGEPIEVAP